ncbi:MAG: hypothetical protein J0M35_20510, partial [Candidatus Obscuribacter phosphatis]|nr:hypothetical protein [Candidatus Obscuribacter phosphatis]
MTVPEKEAQDIDPYADIPDGVDLTQAEPANSGTAPNPETKTGSDLSAVKEQSAPKDLSSLKDDPIDSEAQDNFVESKEPSELLMCLVLASAYLG